MIKRNVKNRIIIILVLAALLFSFTAFSSLNFNQVAIAGTYGDVDSADLWYYSALKMNEVKGIVDAWDKSKLNPVVIAVVDTGVDSSHPLFEGLWYKDKDGNEVGYDVNRKISGLNRTKEVAVTSLKDDTADKHGNSVTGVIAMLIKDLGLQDYVKIYPIKANNESIPNEFTLDSVIEALGQAKKVGADIVNVSLGIAKTQDTDEKWQKSKELKEAIDSLKNQAMIVAAAGNYNKNSSDDKFLIASDGSVLGITGYKQGSGENGYLKYDTSNYGDAYDLSAPAQGIYTACSALGGDVYHYMNATSMATPVAAVGGALLKLRYYAESKTQPTALELIRMMRNLKDLAVTADDYKLKCLNYSILLTQDFANTSYNYAPPEDMSLSHNGTYGKDTYKDYVFMQAASAKRLHFEANVAPFGNVDPDVLKTIKWYLRVGDEETELGSGESLDYLPRTYGETAILARLVYGNDTFEAIQNLYVEYAPYLAGEVRVTYLEDALKDVDEAARGGVIYTGEATKFSLTGIQYVDQTVPIKWYVDGEYVGDGVVFEYKFTKAGKHKIAAQYGDRPIINTTFVFDADVKPFILRPLDLSMLIVGLCIVIAAVTVVSISVHRRKKTKALALNDKTDAVETASEEIKEVK